MPGPTIGRDLKLRDPSVPTAPLSITVPYPVDERLLRLVDLVNEDDDFGSTSKLQLGAALIQAAEANPLWLWDKVVRYQRATVGEAAFWVPEGVDPITFEERKPGRRAVGS